MRLRRNGGSVLAAELRRYAANMKSLLSRAAAIVCLGVSVAGELSAQPAVVCRDSSFAERGAVRARLRSWGADHPDSITVWRACGLKDTYVAAVWSTQRSSRSEYGPRVLVLRRNSSGYSVAFATVGMMDVTLPDLHLFNVGSRVLVLADLGNEGSWGFATYEITPLNVRELELLDVGVPASFSSDPDESAIEFARVSRRSRSWSVNFDTVIVVHPNQPDKRKLVASRRPFPAFQLTGDKWRLVPGK